MINVMAKKRQVLVLACGVCVFACGGRCIQVMNDDRYQG